MTADQIASHFHARSAGPDRWRTRCPVHGGRSGTSLSIGVGENRRTLLRCWSGCTVESICAAAGIKLADLFSEPGTPEPKPQTVRAAEKQIKDLRSRLTKREQVLPVTIVYVDRENLDAGLAWALALSVEGEIVQAVLGDAQ